MKKKLLIILLVITVIIATPIIAFRIYNSLPIYSERVIEEYSIYREDFEIVNDYLLEHFDNVNERIDIIVTLDNNGEFKDLYCRKKSLYLDQKVFNAFKRVNESFMGYTLYSIRIYPDRINYEGFTEKVVTYTKNGKLPKFLYHKGDGVNFNTYPLWDNWYYLKVSLF